MSRELLRAARYFGAEAEANRLPFSEYADDIADHGGYATWKDIPALIRKAAKAEFRAGAKREKDYLNEHER